MCSRRTLFLGMTNRNSIVLPWPWREPEISWECLSPESPQGEKGRHHPQPLSWTPDPGPCFLPCANNEKMFVMIPSLPLSPLLSLPLQVTSSPCAEKTRECAAPVRLRLCCEWCSLGTAVVASPSLDMLKMCLDKALSSLIQLWSANLIRGSAGDLQISLPT